MAWTRQDPLLQLINTRGRSAQMVSSANHPGLLTSVLCNAAGLAMDFTSTGVAVPHTDPEKDDLPASPVLLVATVDGVLRFYTFSHTDRASGRLVQLPRSVPAIAPELLASGASCLPLSMSMTYPGPPLLVCCPERMAMGVPGGA